MRYVLMLLLLLNIAIAKDFGTQGHVYKVDEEGFVTMIKRRLSKVNLNAHRKKMEQIVRDRVHNPVPVKNITSATKNNSFTYDPTYILDEDIYLPSGELLHPAGTKVNPLDHISLDTRLVFIDAREKEQVSWLSTLDKEDIKIVLVAGKPLSLEEELRTPIYFDQ